MRHSALAILLLAAGTVDAQVLRQLTSHRGIDATIDSAGLDDAGTTVYADYNADPFGTNPRYAPQIFKWDAASGATTQVTAYLEGASSVSVSDDGQWVAFVSHGDLLDQNHDESAELFVMRADGSQLAQLTNDPAVNASAVLAAEIAGSANRVIFTANTDPLGANANHVMQIFAVDRDGTHLIQLTHLTADSVYERYRPPAFAVSDDGQRVAFNPGSPAFGIYPNIFKVNADGTGLVQLTNGNNETQPPALAGNGTRLAFVSSADLVVPPAGSDSLYTMNWDGTGLLRLDSNVGRSSVTLSDTGSFVYYAAYDSDNSEIFQIRSTGSLPRTQLTHTLPPTFNGYPVVAGGGARIAFHRGVDAGPAELMVMDGAGGGVRQLTAKVFGAGNLYPDVAADGSRAAFWSNGDRTGGDPARDGALYRVQIDGSGLAQIVDFTRAFQNEDLSLSDDGSQLGFVHWDDLTGQNPNHISQVFRIAADGSGLVQLTPATFDHCWDPEIPTGSSQVLFRSEYGGGSQAIYRVNADGSGLEPLIVDTFLYLKRASAAGQWIVYQSRNNDDGQNPNSFDQLFRYSAATGVERLTADPAYASSWADVSADGSRIAYMSRADPLGTNPSHFNQVFLLEPDVPSLRQLTTAGGAVPRISRDGTWVYFVAGSLFDQVPGSTALEPYRVSVATGVIERVGGLRRGGTYLEYPLAIDATGQHAVFSAALDPLGSNADEDSELFVADYATPPRIQVGKASPTVVSWDVEPSPVRYDVIRGDVANLEFGAGNTIDLGVVTCVEDDSPDADTVGDEDPAAPAPGQALFYLYRGSQGLLAGLGSYGQGSAGRERVATSGGCAP